MVKTVTHVRSLYRKKNESTDAAENQVKAEAADAIDVIVKVICAQIDSPDICEVGLGIIWRIISSNGKYIYAKQKKKKNVKACS